MNTTLKEPVYLLIKPTEFVPYATPELLSNGYRQDPSNRSG